MIRIVERDPVTTLISDPAEVRCVLKYRHEWWRQGQFRKEKRVSEVPLVKGHTFYSGFQRRVCEHLDRRGLKWELEKPSYPLSIGEPALKGITFRNDQAQALAAMIKERRGVWKAPTGSGKTILICGLVSAFNTPTLILVHTEQLFRQTYEELVKFFPKAKVGRAGAGEWNPQTITVGMVQTLRSRELNGLAKCGMVVVDEAHHVSTFDGSYVNVLERVPAPVRFGFTATPPKGEQAVMALEGLVGPLIGSTTYGELQEGEVLAKPKLRFIKIPETDRYKYLRGHYTKVYNVGVVNNRLRNGLIIDEALKLIAQGRTVLILVEQVEHGHILMKMAELRAPGVFSFLYGSLPSDFHFVDVKKKVREEVFDETTGEVVINKRTGKPKKELREKTVSEWVMAKHSSEKKAEEKEAFEAKERKAVIATRIWGEGVNIRSIGAVINGVGGESEIAAIQRFGRGLRADKNKSDVVLVDFIDTNHVWFQRHSMKRICLYSDWGWL